MPTDRQRREADRRRRQRQSQRRAQRARRRRRLTLIASAVGAVVIVAVIALFVVTTNDDDSSTQAGRSTRPSTSAPVTSASASTSPSASTSTAPGTCTYKPAGSAARKVDVPAAKQPSTGTATVAVTTTRGAMTFTLDRKRAPCAVGSFVSLAEQKYFNDTPCHRLTTANIFVLQCGDPTGTGSGGPGYTFGDELTGRETYARGVLAMANNGVNTNGSQFFIVYKDTAALGPKYTIFGTVTAGLSVVDGVAAKGAVGGSDGKPKESISITTAVVK